ncbi:MAG: hypothetical protein CVU69_07590 [Deltaproteobacteria bacterium HGW-Deltaproteobacteria-4]|nr:MAG: hypothetical protein CVU69_07590 [Deltaproteobacteria bacterium HGW-Deltaproteobacteria-4]
MVSLQKTISFYRLLISPGRLQRTPRRRDPFLPLTWVKGQKIRIAYTRDDKIALDHSHFIPCVLVFTAEKG